MILIYRVLGTLIYPLLLIYIFFRKFNKKEHPTRYKEKIFISNFNVKRNENSKLIWFHAASIGEFKSILPIVKELNTKNNNYEFLISTTTLSSGNLVKEEFKNFGNITHRFLPFDVNFIIKNFLILWKPNIIFFVDSEIWPNLILEAKKLKIPLALINARITHKTFKKWMVFSKTAKKIFSKFDLCLASSLETKNALEKLGAKNIFFNGNIKLISTIDKKIIKNLNEKILLNNRFWLAASTHEGEEKFCIDTHIKIKSEYKNIITIIAPRHIDRVNKIKELCKSYNLNAQILNKGEFFLKNSEIIIVNSFGVLLDYYKYSKSVFIGKSIIKKLENEGGQNPIDAVKLGCKIYHGPYVYNFKEIYEILKKNNISQEIRNSSELSRNIIVDLKIPQKEDNEIDSLISDLSQKTFASTMKNINYLLQNETK